MTSATDALSWDERQRLMLLEAQVIWAGAVTLDDLRRAFQVSRAQAGKDVERYQKLWPGNLCFGEPAEAWRAGDRFEPHLLRGTAHEFLQVLRNHRVAPALPLSIVAAGVAPVELLEPPEREFDVRCLTRVTAAIRERRWLGIEYQSMSQPEPRRLEIAPHALAHAGRWHARAWSREHGEFRDFVLARIRGVPELLGELLDAAEPRAEQDWDWKKFVAVKIGAHPGLTEPQRRVVESDYGMTRGVLEKALRVALVPYYLKMLHVGGDDLLRPAAEQQIVLLNRDELEAFNRL